MIARERKSSDQDAVTFFQITKHVRHVLFRGNLVHRDGNCKLPRLRGAKYSFDNIVTFHFDVGGQQIVFCIYIFYNNYKTYQKVSTVFFFRQDEYYFIAAIIGSPLPSGVESPKAQRRTLRRPAAAFIFRVRRCGDHGNQLEIEVLPRKNETMPLLFEQLFPRPRAPGAEWRYRPEAAAQLVAVTV